jgi:AraC-like DNA-binding protein
MTAAAAAHHCRVLGSPWPGVHGTHTDSARHYGRHWHATYGVGLIEHGAHRSASGRGQVEAQAGDLITTNPGEVHDGHPLGGATRRWRIVYFEPEAFAALAGADTSGIALTRPVFRDAPLALALRGLLDRLEARDAAAAPSALDTLACEESLVHGGALLLARHTTRAPAPADTTSAMRAELATVHARLADAPLATPTLAELAALAGLSRWQLLRRFAQAYGLTPHAWLLQQRAERARGLIRAGAPLAHAAAACGFADQSHMTRSFVRQFGFTPGAWRKAVARGN